MIKILLARLPLPQMMPRRITRCRHAASPPSHTSRLYMQGARQECTSRVATCAGLKTITIIAARRCQCDNSPTCEGVDEAPAVLCCHLVDAGLGVHSSRWRHLSVARTTSWPCVHCAVVTLPEGKPSRQGSGLTMALSASGGQGCVFLPVCPRRVRWDVSSAAPWEGCARSWAPA